MDSNISYEEFRNTILKVKETKIFSITNSRGIHDGYTYYRNIRPRLKKYVLTSKQYYTITRTINKLLIDNIFAGKEIKFPERLGKLELRKNTVNLNINDKKIGDCLPIDWDRTLKLWYEDEECYKNRTLIRQENKEVYKVLYNKYKVNYINQIYFNFTVNRKIKRRLVEFIRNNNIDCFNNIK